MSTNKDLQASHQIILLFETAKSSLESILDQLPDFCAMIDKSGKILKGNKTVADAYQTDIECVLGQNLSTLFKKETWNIFLTHFNDVISKAEPLLEFELTMDQEGRPERIFFWSIKSLIKTGDQEIFCVTGRDITKLFGYEKQLAEIFSTIPVAILTLDQNGEIEPRFSEYSRWLLGQQNLSGKNFKKLVFNQDRKDFSPEKQNAIDVLDNFFNMPLKKFSAVAEHLPKEIKFEFVFENKEHYRWLGLKYQPLAYGNEVKKVLIIIEDLTSLVSADN